MNLLTKITHNNCYISHIKKKISIWDDAKLSYNSFNLYNIPSQGLCVPMNCKVPKWEDDPASRKEKSAWKDFYLLYWITVYQIERFILEINSNINAQTLVIIINPLTKIEVPKLTYQRRPKKTNVGPVCYEGQ